MAWTPADGWNPAEWKRQERAKAHKAIERAYSAAIYAASGGTGRVEDVATCEGCDKSQHATGDYLDKLKAIILEQADTIASLRAECRALASSLEAHEDAPLGYEVFVVGTRPYAEKVLWHRIFLAKDDAQRALAGVPSDTRASYHAYRARLVFDNSSERSTVERSSVAQGTGEGGCSPPSSQPATRCRDCAPDAVSCGNGHDCDKPGVYCCNDHDEARMGVTG